MLCQAGLVSEPKAASLYSARSVQAGLVSEPGVRRVATVTRHLAQAGLVSEPEAAVTLFIVSGFVGAAMGRGTCPCGGLCGRPRCCAFSGKKVPELSSAKRAKLALCADFSAGVGCNTCDNCKAAWCSACSGRERKHRFSADEVAVGAERAVRLGAPAPKAKAAPKPKAPLPLRTPLKPAKPQ